MQRTLWIPILLALTGAGCGQAYGGEGEACGFVQVCDEGLSCVSGVCVRVPDCTGNATQDCSCEGGAPGTQSCDADGNWVECVCLRACGDGFVDAGEVCDDGNNVDGDGCAANCASDESCGNGITDAGEVCDDGNNVDGDGCAANCASDESCGNGITDAGEACDDGNNVDGDGCAANCASDESCGNGTLDPGELCDDGNNADDDGCSADCRSLESCGDGTLDPGELCDDGNTADDDDCPSTCIPASCGDGHFWLWMEECDDGNNVDGDGCSASCTLEPVLCGNAVLDPGEACDDGNLSSHDGCSSGCTLESLTWIEPTYAVAPPARGLHAAAFDSARGRMVIFGGVYDDNGLQTLGDTWELGGNQWYEGQPAVSPSARSEAAMVYDAARGVSVLFGGTNSPGQGALADTWEYDGVSWTQITTSTVPPARRAHAMVYDAGRGVTVLFGGQGTAAGDLMNDTWEYDGVNWVASYPLSKPPSRQSHALVYNVSIGQIMLFGGSAGGSPFDDTWTYEGSRWSQVWTTSAPAARSYHAMTYDSQRDRTVLFGGHDYSQGPLPESWEFGNWDWSTATPAAQPTTWYYHSLVYDSVDNRVLIFGGYNGTGYLNSVWQYTLGGSWPDEVCHNGMDDDGDGLIDCADPDCESMPCVSGTCSAGLCI